MDKRKLALEKFTKNLFILAICSKKNNGYKQVMLEQIDANNYLKQEMENWQLKHFVRFLPCYNYWSGLLRLWK